MIEARELNLVFETGDGPVHALKDVDLSVARGDFVSFIGPSGCGKTTLSAGGGGSGDADGGHDLGQRGEPGGGAAGAGLWLCLSGGGAFSVADHRGERAVAAGDHGVFARRAAERVGRVLEMVELAGFENRYPWQLSGGMQQRASIARALAFDADLLLMDEPFGALDEIVRDKLNEQLLELWARTGKTIAFVTHSIPEAVYLSTRIVVMSPRPGRVTDVIESPLPRERPLHIRESREFLEIAARVRDGLRAGVGDEV